MKKILLLISTLLLSQSAFADNLDKSRDEVKQIFISKQEPTAIDAIWTSDTVFKVGVHDNGSSRDGYAEYVCQVLYEHGFKGKNVLVRVVDIDKIVQTGEWVNLGTAQCN